MKTFARRLFEFTLLISLMGGTSYFCYDCGRRDPIPAPPPAAVQPSDPPAPVIEEEKPADQTAVEPQQTRTEIRINGTPFFVTDNRPSGPRLPVEEPAVTPRTEFRATPYFLSAFRISPPPVIEDSPVPIKPKDECGPEPEKLEPQPQTQPLPQAQQQQIEYQCNCRRCRRMFGW